MTSPRSLPNHKKRYFEYKYLSKVHGKPNLQSIINVFRQLKRNEQRIMTRLTGGYDGYLALLLPTTKYDAMPGTTPFIRPINPGIFTPIGTRERLSPGGARTQSGRGLAALGRGTAVL